MTTTIIGNITEITSNLFYDELLKKYCLQITTDNSTVELILAEELLTRFLDRITSMKRDLRASQKPCPSLTR